MQVAPQQKRTPVIEGGKLLLDAAPGQPIRNAVID